MNDCIDALSLKSWRDKARGSCAPRLHADIDWLLRDTLRLTQAALLTQEDLPLSQKVTAKLDHMLARLRDDVPLAYLLGTQPFWSLNLAVTADTLVPRADTEVLVHAALAHLAPIPRPRVADLGTGSGAIALAIAVERPDAEVHATDVSASALAVAQMNAQAHQIENVHFFDGHWTDALPDHGYDLIASNPPYVETTNGELPSTLRHEPRQALAAGADGLDAIRTLTPAACSRLKPGGWLVLEHGNMQADGVSGILRASGLLDISTVADLAGRDRVSMARKPTAAATGTQHGQD